MSVKTPEEMYKEAQQSLGFHVASNLLTIVSLPVTLLSKAWALASGVMSKADESGAEASKS
ncbi:hypothetical protein [Saccharospirillum sp.]|uniref:hypothetical protein n=1 Tax=Saccharospirillum sp. TaxID=2033801 RepID=UPI0034A098E4